MKRLLAILAFLAAGVSVEITRASDCSLIESSQPKPRRKKDEGNAGIPGTDNNF